MKTILCIFCFMSLLTYPQSHPSYKIWSIITNPEINLGDTVKFVVGLNGYGFINPKFTKITVYSDETTPMLLTDDSIIKNKTKGFDTYSLLYDGVPYNFFLQRNPKYPIISNSDFTAVNSGKHIRIVPITPGDKTLKFIAAYSADSLNWCTEESYLTFHVNTWYEQNETWVNILGLLIAFFALIKPSFIKAFCKIVFIQPFQKLIDIVTQRET